MMRATDEGPMAKQGRTGDDGATPVPEAEVDRLRAAIAAKDAALARLKAENRRLEEAIVAYRAARWTRLGEVLRHKPFGLADLAEVGRLGTGVLRARLFPRKTAAVEALPLPPVGEAKLSAPVVEAKPPAPVPAPVPYAVRVPSPAPGAGIRVVHVIANFMTGGSSRLVVDLIEHLGAQYRQCLLTSYVPTPPAYVGADVEVLSMHATDAAFAAYFSRIKPDLVHVHYWGETDEPWYRRVFDAMKQGRYPVIENVNTPVAPFRSPRVVRYVYVSDYVKARFGSCDAVEEVIYPGSNFEMFAPRARSGNDGNTIGMVYRLERDKLDENSIDPVIEAVRRRPGTRALIVGGGTLLAEYQRKVETAGLGKAFEFTGYVAYERLPELYDRMTLFVAPVWKESFGQVSAFAMNMGLPVVGYATGAIPEIIDDDALVATFPDTAMLADIIVRLLDDPARCAAIGRRNRDRAGNAFAVEAMVERYARLYGELTVRTA